MILRYKTLFGNTIADTCDLEYSVTIGKRYSISHYTTKTCFVTHITVYDLQRTQNSSGTYKRYLCVSLFHFRRSNYRRQLETKTIFFRVQNRLTSDRRESLGSKKLGSLRGIAAVGSVLFAPAIHDNDPFRQRNPCGSLIKPTHRGLKKNQQFSGVEGD